MRVLFIVLIVLISTPWIIGVPIAGYSLFKSKSGWARWLSAVGAFLTTIGGIGFFGTALGSLGVFDWLPPSFEWPVGYVGGVVTTGDGMHIVPHGPSSRIQIYSQDWSFKNGWFVDGRGGPIKIIHADRDRIEVVANHSRLHYVFDWDGQVLFKSSYLPKTYADFPEQGVAHFVPTSPWLWMFSHPFVSIAVAICGIVMLNKADGRHTRSRAT